MPRFETTNLDAAHHMLTTLYGDLRLSVTGDQHLVCLEHHCLGSFELHRTTFTMHCDVSGRALRMLAFGHVVRGRVACRRSGYPGEHSVGDAFLAAQPGASYGATLDDTDIEFALLNPALIAQVADSAPGRNSHPVRFTGYEPISPQAAKLWVNSFAYVRDNFTDTPAADHPLLVAGAGRLLATTALSTFPNSALHDPTIEDRHDAHPANLRRAVAFIDDNAHLAICAADIAGAAHVTIRTLQLAFRRHLDTTPMSYLRRVRLENAHRDLSVAESGTTTVGAIAAQWGFDNHSRFASHYHSIYGVTPSRTLSG